MIFRVFMKMWSSNGQNVSTSSCVTVQRPVLEMNALFDPSDTEVHQWPSDGRLPTGKVLEKCSPQRCLKRCLIVSKLTVLTGLHPDLNTFWQNWLKPGYLLHFRNQVAESVAKKREIRCFRCFINNWYFSVLPKWSLFIVIRATFGQNKHGI